MSEWTIYYNPKCGSCRKALDLLKGRGVEPRVVEYLKTPPSAAELADLVAKTGGDAHAVVRAKEDDYAEHGLSDASSNAQIIAAIAKSPILLQRPIVVRGKRAVVARPPEKAEELF